MPSGNRITDPTLLALYRYWQSKAVGSRLPSRQSIDPTEIPTLLPWVFLMDVTHDPLRFRYRLIGTGIVDFLGRDFTGRTINEENYGERATKMNSIFASAVARRDVTAVRGALFYVPSREYQGFCWTMMPLSTDGESIDMLFCGYVPDRISAVASMATEMDASNVEIIPNPEFDDLRPEADRHEAIRSTDRMPMPFFFRVG